ncbi:MAG: Asp-tRNA(Asn)/Glu-tRNA(Gln) amidotransferase subunit GatC, partial [Bacteroidota bacterium]
DIFHPNFYYFVMTIDKALISKLEQLARLELSQEEREKIRTDLNDILAMVEQLEHLDTSGVEPLIHIGEAVNNWRTDEVKHQVERAEALKNAPDQDGTFFKVPKVIDLKG